MIVTIEISPETRAAIARHQALAGRAGEAMAESLETAAVAGAEDIRRQLGTGERELVMRNPGSGLAASVQGWMLDRSAPLAAVGVPANAPAASYAAIHEHGGVIRPKNARALSVPLTREAKQLTSPRRMTTLSFIKRKGKPPLLAEVRKGGKMIAHWVLLAQVTIPATNWLSEGARQAGQIMADAFEDRMGEYAREW